MAIPLTLSVVADQIDALRVDQCIEHDISTWSEHVQDRPGAITKQISATRVANRHLGRQGLDGVPAAPASFRDMLDRPDLN